LLLELEPLHNGRLNAKFYWHPEIIVMGLGITVRACGNRAFSLLKFNQSDGHIQPLDRK